MEKLRLLCLHGYRGTAEVLRRQLAPLAEGLDDLAEFVCLDAPSLAVGDFGWWRAASIENAAVQMDARVSPGAKRYHGWQRTRQAIVSAFVREGPFDGVFGFSQGAALTSLLVGLRARADFVEGEPARPGGEIFSRAEPLAFDFAVMAGGFVCADADLAMLYSQRSNYDLPSAHIIGRSDAVVPREASLGLASKFKNPLLLEHEGGHVLPSAPHTRQAFRTFLEEMRERKKANLFARPGVCAAHVSAGQTQESKT